MKNNDKMDLQKLLSWKEVFQLGEITDNHTLLFGSEYFKKLCSKSLRDKFMDDYDKLVIKPIQEAFPKLAKAIPYFDIRFRYDKEHLFVISPECFFVDILIVCFGDYIDGHNLKELATNIANMDYEEAKATTLGYLGFMREELNKKRYSSDSSSLLIESEDGKLQLSILDVYKMVNYAYKNYDYIYSELLKIRNYQFLDSVSKDSFMLQMGYYIFHHHEASIKSGSQVGFEYNSLCYLHNYKLLVDYLTEVNSEKYTYSFKEPGSNYILTSKDLYKVITDIDEAAISNDMYRQFVEKYKTYDDLLKDKAKDTWNRIRKERFYKTVECNWEVIPEGNIKNSGSGRSVRKPSISSNNGVSANLKKAYDLLDKKVDVFYQQDCEQLVGKNHFIGYIGFLYPNDIVIFERFYKVSKKDPSVKKPTMNEAIYVMHRDNFEELSKLSKSEIISYIQDFGNKDVMRIYHKGAWMERVSRIINATSYNENDLTIIDKLVSDISIQDDKGKIKVYE